MSRFIILCLSLVFVLGLQQPASALLPALEMNFSNADGSLTGRGFFEAEQFLDKYFCDGSVRSGDGSVRLFASLEADADPYISMTLGATNFANVPITFTFLFGPMPIVLSPVGSPVYASIVGGINDINKNGGFLNIGPNQATVLENFVSPNAGLGGPFFTWGAGQSLAYGPSQGAVIPYGPAGAYTFNGASNLAASFFGERVSFTLSPGDSAALTAFCEITPIPLPPTALLLGSGLVAVISLRRRRR